MKTKSIILCGMCYFLCACTSLNNTTDPNFSATSTALVKINKKGSLSIQPNAITFAKEDNSEYHIVDTDIITSYNINYLMVHGVSKTKATETITVIYPLTAKGTLNLEEPKYACEGYNCSFCEMVFDDNGTPVGCYCLEGIPAIFASCKFSTGTLKPGDDQDF
ncbi:MAG: hypothetical protein ACI392_04420 [Paludibacteraceae bacterium]